MAWDRTVPATAAAIASSPVRANFVALDQSLMGQNLVRDPYFLIWPAGDAVAPAHYKIVGAPTIARETAAGKFKTHDMAPSLTGSATGQLIQTILNTTDFEDAWQGVPISFGCWVRSDTASVATVGIADGVGSDVSVFHTGGDSFEWLTGTRILDASATKIELQLDSLASGAKTYFDFPTVVLGAIPPQHPIPPKIDKGVLYFPQGVGVAETGIRKNSFRAERPFIVTNVSLFVATAPTGASLIVDVNHDQAGTATTMFGGTKAVIAIAAKEGGRNPDGTYQNRCFQGGSDTDDADDRQLTVDIDQIGSSVVGSDLNILVRALQFSDPLEAYRDTVSIGNE